MMILNKVESKRVTLIIHIGRCSARVRGNYLRKGGDLLGALRKGSLSTISFLRTSQQTPEDFMCSSDEHSFIIISEPKRMNRRLSTSDEKEEGTKE